MKMSSTAQWFVRWASRVNIGLYRMTGGAIGGKVMGAPVLLLTTIGRKSGEPRTVPLMYLQHGDGYVLVASKAGHDEHPLWFNNLEKTPDVTVEVRREKRQVRARVASEQEKAVLWPELVKMYSGYGEYQTKTERIIPVVILDPR